MLVPSPRRLLPAWIAQYPGKELPADLLAGVIVTLLVLPQSLAYALLAGLPPQAGLYASIVPVIVYALFGSSMVQAVGPVAITAIMTYSVLAPIAMPQSPEYIALAAVLSWLSGLIILMAGLLKLGFLSQLLSRPVIAGFISGSAVLIVLSQLKQIFGLVVAGNEPLPILAALMLQVAHPDHPVTLVMGGSALFLLLGGRYLLPELLKRAGMNADKRAFITRLTPLLVIVLATGAVHAFALDEKHGIAVIGAVAAQLGDIKLRLPDAGSLRLLVVPALLVALIGMVQNISMSQALAIKRRERVDANRELLGLGSANIAAAFYGGMPVGGGVSRSAINVAAGAQTPLASIVSAVVMIAVLLGAAPWFARVPLTALAASIIVAAIGMIDLRSLRQAWAYDRADALAYLGTALGLLLLGLEAGIALGILLSLATLLLHASKPHIAVIGRIPDSEHFRNVERHAVETIPGVLMLRIDESLFFGNLNAVEARLSLELAKAGDIHDVVLIMSAINRVDTTAMEFLTDLNHDLRGRRIRLHLAEIKGPVQDRLLRSPLWKSLSGQVFLSVNSAFETLAGEAGRH